jgi:hypothetical protein
MGPTVHPEVKPKVKAQQSIHHSARLEIVPDYRMLKLPENQHSVHKLSRSSNLPRIPSADYADVTRSL